MTVQHKQNCIIEFKDEKYTIKTKRCGRDNFINIGDLAKYFNVPRIELARELQKKCGYGILLEHNYICMEHLNLIKIPDNDDARAFINVLKTKVIPYLLNIGISY